MRSEDAGSKRAKSEHDLQRLVEYVSSQTHPGLGMTNELLQNLTSQLCPNFYRGLYMAKEMSTVNDNQYRNSTFIINLGSHFVTLHVRPDAIIYVDPLGQPCQNPHVQRFIRQCKRPMVLHNRRRIQSQKSIYCGLYALLFSRCFDTPASQWPIPFPLKFRRCLPTSSNNSASNDQLCVNYLRRFIQQLSE